MRGPRPSGPRVGALLQALIAREPVERASDDQGVAPARVLASPGHDCRRCAVNDGDRRAHAPLNNHDAAFLGRRPPVLAKRRLLKLSSLRSIFSCAKRVFRDRRVIVRQTFVVQSGRIGSGAWSFILHRTLVDVLIP
jgi:hypothetical protein